MSNIKKLFLVRTKAATAYVVADGMDNAYAILRKWLDDRDYGITANRELGSVEVVAVERDYMGTSQTSLLLLSPSDKEDVDGVVDDVIDA